MCPATSLWGRNCLAIKNAWVKCLNFATFSIPRNTGSIEFTPRSTDTMAATERVFVWRLITLAWLLNMFWMSTEHFSGVHSESILRVMLRLLDFGVSPNTLNLVNSVLRKVAHGTEYAILGFLVYRSLFSSALF